MRAADYTSRDGTIRMYRGDCLAVLPEIESASVDLALTDPPYGHNNNNGDLIHRREAALGRLPSGADTPQGRPIANDGAEANDLFRAVRLPHVGNCDVCGYYGPMGPNGEHECLAHATEPARGRISSSETSAPSINVLSDGGGPEKAPIVILVHAVPVGQPRVRATSRGGHTKLYTPRTIKNARTGESRPHPILMFKAMLRLAAAQAHQGPPLTGPLRVDVEAVFPRGTVRKKDGTARLWQVARPDRDNIDKAVLDALTGVVFANDWQVCDGRIQKWRAAADEQPHVRVTITRI